MRRDELISKLLEISDQRKQKALLKKHSALLDPAFAEALKNTYYDSWTTAPEKTRNAARALEILTALMPGDETRARALWVRGIADLTEGKLEKTITDLDEAAAIFGRLGEEHKSAQTQVAKIIALALLGRYDAAVETGEAALRIFEKYEDELAAGKIEKNLGNIVARQDDLSRSEKYYLSAIDRFRRLGDLQELTMCEVNLADTYAELHEFREAEKFYAKALRGARQAQMFFVEAEIEASMGNLALFRGKYRDALNFLELARRKFASLKVAHRSAVAELEIADIYLELNLIDEAYQIYGKAANALRKQKLQGEEARARAGFARAAFFRGESKKAKNELEKSARLFLLEKNPAGAAGVKVTEAQLELSRRRFENALALVREAERLLAKTENPRSLAAARWLDGEILRALGKRKQAEKVLAESYSSALKNENANLAQICLNSLGRLALETGDRKSAKTHFKKAVRMIETLRAPLPAEEFRMSFLADKLDAFESLAKIYLAEKDFRRAFEMIEKARARTLFESLERSFETGDLPKNARQLSTRLDNLREELNWFYSRLNRAETSDVAKLQREARRREKQIADVMRQIESTRADARHTAANAGRNINASFDLEGLQRSLSDAKALVEFVKFDGAVGAFVVRGKKLDFVENLATEDEIFDLLENLRFQFAALRFGKQQVEAFLPELKKRADFYLQRLFEKLVAPLEHLIEARDLVIVPTGALNYVPFHALFDGAHYLVESREVVFAPAAAVWQFLEHKRRRQTNSALLIGYADESIPLVDREIETLATLFERAKTFKGENATSANYAANAPDFDVLHLACHGQFRPDNPLFSSLHLADGFVTVRDIYAQRLSRAELVTLSACETGLSKIFAGDEILGLARGFLTAGARSLVLSLWTVSDEATAELMREFYINLQRGAGVGASLRAAQLKFIEKQSHPYFWSPFAVIGK